MASKQRGALKWSHPTPRPLERLTVSQAAATPSNIGGELEAMAGHIEALAFALDDFADFITVPDDAHPTARGWLFLVLLDALRREAESVQRQASHVYVLGRKAAVA